MIQNLRGLNSNISCEDIAFGSRREDNNLVLGLTKDKGSIIPVKERQIKQALQKLSEDGSSQNINFLLSVAQNLTYGYSGNSPLGKFLDGNSNIADKTVKQNTEWDKLLQLSIESAIQKNNSVEKTAFEKKLAEIFPNNQTKQQKRLLWISANSDNQTFLKQAELINLRNNLLNSNELNKVTEGLSKKEIEDLTRDTLSAKRNIDYFLALSEYSVSEKIEILKMFSHFMSDEYKINEQLKDKKVKVLSEIVNDIIIKNPEQNMLTIKNVDQRKHGMCAAISICRKALAYEDKVNYVKTLLSELDNNPEMEVFDITDLANQSKIPVSKIHIDFDTAIKEGYRIIDASALQWMHISGTIGNGEMAVEKYVAFNKNDYGIFTDTKWYNDLPQEHVHEHNYLRTLIKAREDQQRIEERMIRDKLFLEEFRQNKTKYIELIGSAYSKTEDVLKNILPGEDEKKIKSLADKLLNIEKLDNDKFKVNPKDEIPLKKLKIIKLIKSESDCVKNEDIYAAVDKIYQAYLTFQDITSEQERAGKIFSPSVRASHYKDLFILEANKRICNETMLDNPDVIEGYSRLFNIPDKQTLLSDHISRLMENAKNSNQDKSVLENLEKLNQEIHHDLPKQIDLIMSKMSGGNRKNGLANMINQITNVIDGGDKKQISYYFKLFKIAPDKKALEAELKKLSEELNTEISEKRLAEISDKVGYKDQIAIVRDHYRIITAAFEKGIPANMFNIIAEHLGVPPDQFSVYDGFKALEKYLDQISLRYDEIADITKMPSAKDRILKKLEEKGEILPRNTLDNMQAKFDAISEYERQKDIAKREGKKLTNPDIYKFNDVQIQQFKRIKANFSKTRRDTEREYKLLNKKLASPLEKLYEEIGRQKGHFWLAEEGHSGLFTSEQIRIFEQMTGKPHYAEPDISKTIEHIKKTGRSGISATNVAYDEYSGHAQYIADVKDVEVLNPDTGKIEQREVLWHDNSWGPVERDKVWKDFLDNEKTSYGKNYGGEQGFLLDSEYKVGTLVEDFLTKFGTHKAVIPDNKKLKKLNDGAGERFPIFRVALLDGHDFKLFVNSMSLIDKINDYRNNRTQINKFVTQIKKHGSDKINTKKLESMEDYASVTEEKLALLITGDSTKKGIESLEDFNKLPENHKLKLLLRKISLIDSNFGHLYFDAISSANSHHEIDSIEKNIINYAKSYLIDEINEFDFDFNSIKSADDLRNLSPVSGEIITLIDKKFNPANDKEMLEHFKNIKNMDQKSLKKLINDSTTDELNLKFTDPYSIVQKIRAEQYHARKSLHKAVLYDTIFNKFELGSTKGDFSELELLYRNFYITLSNLDTKSLNQYKTTIFDKYQVRPAFPQINLATKQDIQNAIKTCLDAVQEGVTTINSLNNKLEIYDLYDKIDKIKVSDQTTIEDININIRPILNELKSRFKDDDVFSALNKKIQILLNSIDKLNPGEKLGTKPLNQLNQIFLNIKTFKTACPTSLIKSQLKETHSDLNESIRGTATLNVATKYHSKFMGMVQRWVKNLIKHPNDEANKHLYNDLMQQIEKRHILNTPVEILHSLMKALSDKTGNKETNKMIVNTFSYYLENALNAGKLTEIEFEIIKNSQKGIMNKMKLIMDALTYHSKDGTTSAPVSSPKGLKYLLYNLIDTANDNRTLKLFLETTGLSEQAVDVVKSGCNLNRHKQLFDLYYDRILKYDTDAGNLDKMAQTFIRKTAFKCKQTRVSEVFDDFLTGIDLNFAKSGRNNSKYLNTYKSTLKELVEKIKDNPVDSNIAGIVAKIHEQSFYIAGQNCILKLIVKLNGLVSKLDLKYDLLDIINLSEHSKLYLEKKTYQENISNLLKLMYKGINELNKVRI